MAVYPVHNLVFEIATDGRDGASFAPIADLESFEVSIDGNVEEWTPMDQGGWTRRLMTGKSLSVSVSGKRNYGDPGNDYVASMDMVTGLDANSVLKITFPDGSTLEMACVIHTGSTAGGSATDVNALEAEFLSDGNPNYTEATP